MTKEELAYWYWLSDVPGVGPTISRKLLSAFESPVAVFNASKNDVIASTGIRETLADSIQRAKGNIEKYLTLSENQMKLAEALQGFILTAGDSPYSSIYATQSNEQALPPVIHVLGEVTLLEGRKFAIVGTRAPSHWGKDNAFQLALGLARSGMTVVSGLALGIDAEAHRGALEGNGRTIAVLGCGADVVYPPANRNLYADILSKGLIVSEFPFGTRPSSQNLRKRNRTLVVLSESVVVVECSIKSGALIAARFAVQQRKPIFSFRYPESVDNRGGEWLISKSLAIELTEASTDSILRAVADYQVSSTVTADKAFLEIWPRKQRKEVAKGKGKKQKKSEKTSGRRQRRVGAGKVLTLADEQLRLPLGAPSEKEQGIESERGFSFATGDIVVHPTFGKGEVTKITAVPNDYQITVRFSRKSIRTFSWRFTNLSKG
jgi:DNA processing protein